MGGYIDLSPSSSESGRYRVSAVRDDPRIRRAESQRFVERPKGRRELALHELHIGLGQLFRLGLVAVYRSGVGLVIARFRRAPIPVISMVTSSLGRR